MDNYPNDEQLADIGERVCDMAREIFEFCGAADDYCHQGGLVFGGTNRIMLNKWGWTADKGLCTARFLDRFEDL